MVIVNESHYDRLVAKYKKNQNNICELEEQNKTLKEEIYSCRCCHGEFERVVVYSKTIKSVKF